MTIKTTASPQETKALYSGDMARRTSARIRGNLRIDLATNFVLRHIRNDSRILDIGCGIGIATERIAGKARKGRVYGLDISNDHIKYCRRTIKRDNISFHEMDILAEFASVKGMLEDEVDVITLIDVIEHLPSEHAESLFSNLRDILAPGGQILMTFPSPEYQKQLYATELSRIQPVDLVLEVEDIQKLARRTGMSITSFSYVDVWKRNQYIHCRISGSVELDKYSMTSRILHGSAHDRIVVIRHLATKFLRRLIEPFLERKYG